MVQECTRVKTQLLYVELIEFIRNVILLKEVLQTGWYNLFKSCALDKSPGQKVIEN